MMTEENQLPYELPTHCVCCGALLMGGDTVHKPECPIRRLIEDSFPPRTA